MSSHAPAHLLLVEDEQPTRERLDEMLSDEGFRVTSVADGAEALAWLRAQPAPDVILLDVMMPVVDAFGFRREQLADLALARIPVIVLSAFEPQKTATLGAAAVVKKPIDFDELLATLEATLGRSVQGP